MNEKQILDLGASHKYTCKCEICRQYWKLVGPEEIDEQGDKLYGPFYEAEVMKENEGEPPAFDGKADI